jgi:hypothetical protein
VHQYFQEWEVAGVFKTLWERGVKLDDGWGDQERATPMTVVAETSPIYMIGTDRERTPTLTRALSSATPAADGTGASQKSNDQRLGRSLAWKPVILMICILIMALHADQRFNTPLRQRSTTRRRLYQEARFAYIFLTVSLFVVSALALGFWDELERQSPYLQVLIPLLFLTDGIPHLPFLREIDLAVLEFFKRTAKIPREVERWSLQLRPELLSVKASDLADLKTFIEDESALRNELQNHLRADEGDGVEISEYRLTRVLMLYKHLTDLALLSRYERFFGDYAEEWAQAKDDFQNFCNRAATALELAAKYRSEHAVAAHKELIEETRDNFRVSCRQVFSQLAVLLAGALVSCEQDEEHIAEALRQVGFDLKYEKTIAFPVDELCLVGLIVLVYLLTAYPLVQHFLGSPKKSALLPPATWPILIFLSYVTAVTITVALFVLPPSRVHRTRPALGQVHRMRSSRGHRCGSRMEPRDWVAVLPLRLE